MKATFTYPVKAQDLLLQTISEELLIILMVTSTQIIIFSAYY